MLKFSYLKNQEQVLIRRSWFQVDDSKGWNWTVQTTETGRLFIKLDGPKDSNWTAQKAKTSRSKGMEMYGQKE